MATYIHGIGASENIDTSGEIVSIAGLDISSLDKDGVFNWEHKADMPSQVVGKILKARKIFSDADCEDDYQLKFWEKCKVPFLYVMGELLDDYSDSAREVAGKFRYDADRQNERNMMNFSVEGSKISKEGITVSRSIARKITITILPCNKAAVAEMVATPTPNPKKSAVDELFKTEAVEIEVLQIDKNSKLWDLLKKEDPNKHAAKLGIKPFNKNAFGGQSPDNDMGAAAPGSGGGGPTSAGGLLASEDMKKAITRTGSGVEIKDDRGKNAPKLPGARPAFGSKPTAPAAPAAKMPAKPSAPAKPALSVVKPPARPSASPVHTPQSSKLYDPRMSKALEAGSGMAGPANLSQGAALGKEELDKNLKKAGQSGLDPQSGNDPGAPRINKPLRSKDSRIQVLNPKTVVKSEELRKDAANPKLAPKDAKVKQIQSQVDAGTYKPSAAKIGTAMLGHPEKPLKGTRVQKSEMLQRAESEYLSWNKREQFENWMKMRMPTLTRGEIQVIGQTMLLQKSLKQEKLLKDFYNPSGGSALGKSKK